MRLTIRSLMIAVVVVAGVLAIPPGYREPAAALTFACVAPLAARWLLSKGGRRLAASCFWALAILANVLFVVLCIVPSAYLPMLLCYGWFFFLLPSLLVFGFTWATLASREVLATQLSRSATWISVAALTALPPFTGLSLWPLHLAFLMAKPALERQADQVAAGQAVTYPTKLGLFWIAGSALDPASGNVGLMIDPDPNGPTAFVRVNSVQHGCPVPVRGDVLHVWLGNRWCYHIED
jgi:hypothetical protein